MASLVKTPDDGEPVPGQASAEIMLTAPEISALVNGASVSLPAVTLPPGYTLWRFIVRRAPA